MGDLKKCSVCGLFKKFSEFYNNKNHSTGKNSSCKCCVKISDLAYSRTFKGLITKAFAHQKWDSTYRSHPKPAYTKIGLKRWIKSQPNFKVLWDGWVNSGYKKDFKPSVDRIDSTLPYSFKNIQLVTWSQNETNGHNEMRFRRTAATNTTGARGVSKHKDGGYVARIHDNKKRIYLGYFQALEKAQSVRLEAERILEKGGDIKAFVKTLKLRSNK